MEKRYLDFLRAEENVNNFDFSPSGGRGMFVLIGRERRARCRAQTGVGGLSQTALPCLLESPHNQWEHLQSDTVTNFLSSSVEFQNPSRGGC